MKLHKRVTWLAIGAVNLIAVLPVSADVIMGVFPRRAVPATHKAFAPLAKELEKQLGEKVILVIPKDFKTFWRDVKSKKFDLVHYNQYHYIKSHKELGYNVALVNEELGSKMIRGQLTVRKDSGIKTLKDLKGKTILFGGGPKAMGSYIAPTAVLKKAGLVAGKDYKVVFAKNPPSAMLGTYHKLADVAGTGDIIFKVHAVTKRINVKEMKMLAVSEPFIHLVWAVSEKMDAGKKSKIQKIMSSLVKTKPGQKILKAAKVTNFHIAYDKDFKKVREIAEYALGEKP